MSDWLAAHLADHLAAAREMTSMAEDVRAVGELLIRRYEDGGIVYTLGNGGSAADAQHLTGELIGHYQRDRRPLAAVTLTTDATVTTCVGNDYSFDDVFSRQVEALARPGDVVIAFTTSGRSANVVKALERARINGATTVLFGGGDGGPAKEHADYLLLAPGAHTPRVQEMHVLMLHVISEMVDAWAAGEEPSP